MGSTMGFLVRILFIFCTLGCLGQEAGMPLYRIYTPQEYQAHRQNWTADQDGNGLMYFANTKGLLIFDGEEWRLERLPNKGHIRSLDIYGTQIFVGGFNELGFFEKKGNSYIYTSFLEYVPQNLRDFGRVWTSLYHKGHIYYQTDTFVLRVKTDGSDSKIWADWKHRLWKVLVFDDSLLLNIPKRGMLRLNENDQFVEMEHGEAFINAATEFILKINSGQLFEKSNTLQLFDGEHAQLFENEAYEIFKKYGINTTITIPSGDLVVATINKGLVVLSPNGKLKSHITTENGLSNDVVRGLFVDRQGSLWCALDAGITRLDFDSPISYFDKHNGLHGSVLDIQKFNGRLYVATNDGLLAQNQDTFERVANITTIVRDLDTIQNQLLVLASYDNTFAIDADQNIKVIKDSKIENNQINQLALTLSEDKNSSAILFDDGMYQIKWDGKDWIVQGQLKGVSGGARSFLQLRPGQFWIGTNSNGVYRFDYSMDANGFIDFDKGTLTHYGNEKGVPPGYSRVFQYDGKLFIISLENEVYLYNPTKDQFSAITNFSSYFNLKDESVYPYDGQSNGILWLNAKNGLKEQLVKIETSGKGGMPTYYPFSNVATSLKDPFSTINFHSSEDKLFFGILDEIIAYDLTLVESKIERPNIIISQIATSKMAQQFSTDSVKLDNLAYNNNLLSFSYASPNYKDAQNKQYQYKLEGFDEKWSTPSSQSSKEYTSLPPGDYTFKVKALNDYFVESPEATVSFRVSPPWFWNNVSILFYILLLGLSTYLISQWRNQALKRKNQALEEAINKAVAETQRQADEIAHLYEVKNQFFSNISHELRTPLTLILGPSSDLMEDEELEANQKNKLTFINNNAKRLLRLINQLLDLSKLEAGKLDLKASQQDIVQMVSTITESFSSMAVTHGIKLSFSSDEDELYVFYDVDKMEKVLINLLSNAMKFTKSGDTVNVSVVRRDKSCVIQVKDSGVGINQDQLPYVFDRFFQADNRESREHEGTGIGLSLAKELVELHGGTIEAESKHNQGSLFRVVLRLGKEHLKEHQLAKSKPSLNQPKEKIAKPILEEATSVSEDGLEELILLVEDNSEMRAYIKSYFGNDYRVLEAENGLMGFEMAQEHVPDLIISDVMMPKMDGTELCKKLKDTEATSHIPIILLTAKASEEDKIKGLNIQADAYLAKPFNKLELQAQVKNLITNRKKLQRRFAKTALISPRKIAVTSMEQQFLEKLVDEIEENIGNETFGVEQLAEAINLSRSQVHRKMVSLTDQTPSLFIRKYRLERAKQLLEQGAGRVSDIAFQVGFSSPSYFTKCFVEEFGKTPKDLVK